MSLSMLKLAVENRVAACWPALCIRKKNLIFAKQPEEKLINAEDRETTVHIRGKSPNIARLIPKFQSENRFKSNRMNHAGVHVLEVTRISRKVRALRILNLDFLGTL
jgi:hypothetical protein